MQLLQFRVAGRLGSVAGTGKGRGHTLDRLPLPGSNHCVVNAMPGGQLCHRQIAPDRFQRNLCLEISAVPLPCRLHSCLTPEVGMSLTSCPENRHHLSENELTLSASTGAG